MTESRVALDIKSLKKYYPVTKGIFKRVSDYVKAVDGVDLKVSEGETLGIVGESGCGKTTLGKCLVRLHNPDSGELQIRQGKSGMVDFLSMNKADTFNMRQQIQMVFQDPFSSLNPMKTILQSFDEPLRIHGFGNRAERKEIIARTLKAVNLQPDYMYRYPHEFSGGQCQRISIGRALSLNPKIIVADEPVSSLDVSIQAQILNLLKDLQDEYNLTYIFIAHDLSVVQYMSDRVAVMYLGKVVELMKAENLYEKSLHPYTEALLSAVPVPVVGKKKDRIILSGDVPSPVNPPSGCHFHPRCHKCMDVCKVVEPELKPLDGDPDHLVSCHLVHD